MAGNEVKISVEFGPNLLEAIRLVVECVEKNNQNMCQHELYRRADDVQFTPGNQLSKAFNIDLRDTILMAIKKNPGKDVIITLG